ncbi:MAG: DUF418 domain-containing protein [Tidjanibacter sp.]|nr:DUF418 domain-containing protein [Tidjanibacter sp.]
MKCNYTPSTLPNTRIDVADVLRGIALAGIVLIHCIEHFNFYSFPAPASEFMAKLDQGIWDTVFFLLAGKMYAIFATMFGLSFFIQHDNQAQQGKDFRLRFAWRLVLLFCFGLFDLCFYNGDILTVYAVCGFFVIPLIRASNKVLGIIFALLIIQPIELIYIIGALFNPELTPLNLGSGQYFGTMMPAQANGTFFEALWASLSCGLPCNFLWAIENGRLTQTIYLFIVGIYIGRRRLFYNEGDNLKTWKKVLLWATVGFAVLWPAYEYLPAMADNRTIAKSLNVMLNMWKNFAMMLMIVSGIVLLFYQTKAKKSLMAFSYFGRMSMSNYIIQAILGSFLFYGWGLALHLTCRHTVSFLIGIGMLIVQMVFSYYWFRNHKRGPLEGIWRKLTWL